MLQNIIFFEFLLLGLFVYNYRIWKGYYSPKMKYRGVLDDEERSFWSKYDRVTGLVGMIVVLGFAIFIALPALK